MTVLKIDGFWPSSDEQETPSAGPGEGPESRLPEGLEAFGSESSTPANTFGAGSLPAADAAPPGTHTRSGAWVLVLLAVIAVTATAWYAHAQGLVARAFSGTVTIDTAPAGAPVFVGGKDVGSSPVTLTLAPGQYDVRVGEAERAWTARVNVSPRATVVAHYELLAVPAPSPSVGSLPPKPEVAAAGWVTVSSPVALQVRESGRLIGTTEFGRLVLAPGEHTLDFADDVLGFRVRRQVQILPGRSTPLRIQVPDGALSVNAEPWAEVFVDGQRVGETPIGNLARPIGKHQVVFRHPDLGERREVVLVTTQQPARLGVDMRKK